MRLRCQPSLSVPACAATSLAVLLSLTAPAPVGLAQSGPPPLTPWRGFIDHASATLTGHVPTFGVEVAGRAISGDGRFVVMQSLADSLVADDFNWAQDIFLRDRQTGTMSRISQASNGGDADGFSDRAAISTNGRHVVFMSSATNLVDGDTNGVSDIFVRDLERATTVRVSVATGGAQSDSDAYAPAISATGRFVAFVSNATTLAPGRPPYAPMQLYVHDRDADGNGTFDEPGGTATTLDSVSSSGAVADNYTHHVRISSTGQFVLFESNATNLDPVGNLNAANHVYLRDRHAATTTLIDRSVTGGPSSWGTDYRTADMSDDGRYITYATYSTDIVSVDANWNSQVLRYDAAAAPAERTTLVTVLPDGTLGNGYSFDTAVSGDGRYIAFRSTSTNLASPAQPDNTAGMFVRDMASGTVTRVDVIGTGEGFDHSFPYSPSISADGTAVAFMSDAMNAVEGQYTFGAQHTFVATAFSVSPLSASHPMAGGSGSIEVNTLATTGWRAVSLDPWIMVMVDSEFAAGPRTVQYVVEPNSAGILRHGRIKVGSTIVGIHQDGDGDSTPPLITPIVTGTLSASGWYTSNITVQWSVTDPDSEIVNIGYGCVTSTFTGDFIYANPTCEATSHGGTSSVSVPLQRDATPPSIAINAPSAVFYRTGAQIVPAFDCSEPWGYAGVASCTVTAGASPLDTTTPGRHLFTVTAADQAGNTGSKTVEYFVGTGACVVPPSTPKAWWRFEGSMSDTVNQLNASPTVAAGWFDDAVAGKGWVNGAAANYLDTSDGSRLVMSSGLTVALWVKPVGQSGQSGTLVTKPAQYRMARYPDGTLRWAFSHSGGYTWINTGAVIPSQHWSHVVVSYDNGLVRSYLNGRLVHSQQLSGVLVPTGDPSASLTIGGRGDLSATLFGTLDDVQIYDRAIPAAEIEAIALAGSGSLCLPSGSNLTVTAPSTVNYGSTFRVTAVLRDEQGNPLANRQVWLNSHLAPGGFAGGVSGTTDASGTAYADLPVSSTATVGEYARAASAVFEGDVSYRPSSAETPATLVAGIPVVTWPSPAPIVYGTALGAELNASASLAGSFSYSPAAGMVLDAGVHTLSVTFTPNDSAQWAPATATTTITVNKAVPVVTAAGGTFAYDKQAHPGSGTATGVLGETLAPVQLTYNGTSETPPVNAGAHIVRASFPGSTNYLPGDSDVVPLTINRAVPTVEISGNSLFYSGAPRQVIVTVRGAGNDELNPYTVIYNGSAALPVEAGSYVVDVQYAGSANYEAVTGSGLLVINKTTPIMSLSAENVTYDGQPHGASAAVIGVKNEWLTPVVITYSGSTTVPTAAGEYAVEARYDGSANYSGVSRTTTLTIFKKAPYLLWFPGPSSVSYGTALGPAQWGATADVPGTFSYSPPPGTVLNVGTHTLTAAFSPADSVNYTAASITATITVTKAAPSVSWTQPASIIYGTALGAAQLTATATVPGTFTYSPAAGTVLNAGTHVLSVTFTPDDLANYSVVTAGRALTVTQAAAAISWPVPANISYGTALGAAQLTATADVPGTFTYSPAAGTVLPAGSHQLSVTFVPADGANHTGSTASRMVTVAMAPLTIAANNTSKAFGAAMPAFSATGSGFVNGESMASLGGALAFTTPATVASAVGTYLVVPHGVSSSNYAMTFVPGTLTVLRAGTVVTVAASPNPSGFNQPVTYVAAVGPVAPGTGSPSGLVQFFDGGSLVGTATPLAGSAALTTNGLTAGSHTITATYSGDASFSGSSATTALTVRSASSSSTTTLTSSRTPSAPGQSVTFKATVAAPSGTNGGIVEFYDGSTLLGSGVLSNGLAQLTTTALQPGGHAMIARFVGNASVPPSTSVPLAQTVGTQTKSSSAAVTVSPAPASLGSEVTITAVVTGGQQKAPTGDVLFVVNGQVLGQAAVSVSGSVTATAILRTSALPRGTHTIVVVYLSDATFRASSKSTSVSVN